MTPLPARIRAACMAEIFLRYTLRRLKYSSCGITVKILNNRQRLLEFRLENVVFCEHSFLSNDSLLSPDHRSICMSGATRSSIDRHSVDTRLRYRSSQSVEYRPCVGLHIDRYVC